MTTGESVFLVALDCVLDLFLVVVAVVVEGCMVATAAAAAGLSVMILILFSYDIRLLVVLPVE